MKNRAKRLYPPNKWLLAAALLVFISALPPNDASSQQSQRKGVVLHEFFDPSLQIPPFPDAPSDGKPAQTRPQTAANNPPHVPGQPPALSLDINDQEPIFTGEGPLFDAQLPQPNGALDPRTSTNQLDDQTDHVDPLQYFPQFDPSILPYKRQVAQNQVVRTADGNYLIQLASQNLRAVEVSLPAQYQPTVSTREDTFWGSFLIRTQSGQLHPIPSVSPDQRILQLQSEPAVPLTIVADQADNVYIQTDYTGLVRVNMQLAVPRFYFDGEMSTTVRWTDFPPALRPNLAPEINTVVNRVLTRLAINNRQMSPHEALMRLVEHFRDFESRALTQSAQTGDMFETIALGKAGVCRHRSHAFIITAHALGIPTRFIYNETHAFVEVYWPTQGWRRIDLGGAAENVDVHNNDNRPLHDGTQNDPLPQPPAYISERDRILGQTSEENEAQEIEAAENPAQSDHSQPAESARQPQDATSIQQSQTPEITQQKTARDSRQPTKLKITSANQQVLRGQGVALQGRLTTRRGEPIANQNIKIMLGPGGATSPQSATLLGTAKTDIDGRFVNQLPIPSNLSIGRWTLTAIFDGTPTLQPATSPP